MLQRALHLAVGPALVSIFVTLARFFSERAGMPAAVSNAIGIFWLTLIVASYLGLQLAKEARGCLMFFLTMFTFALASRIPVVAMWWVTKTFGLGTHYDLYDNWSGVLAGQLVLGTLIQMASGGIVGVAVIILSRRSQTPPAVGCG